MKKGFTLIELLAVIVVLAVIAVIAIPIILGVVETTKKAALKESANGLIEEAGYYYMQYGVADNARFDIEEGQINSTTENTLLLKGYIEDATVLINTKGEVAVCINDGEYSVYKNYRDNKLIEIDNKNCNIPTGQAVVFLENESTIREYTNEELTTIVTSLQEQIQVSATTISSLEQEITVLKNNTDGNPTGTVISYMGNNVPAGYLSCDGTVYNISDYQALADQIKNEFGSYNYYGGDGTDTFAVPDLRGEFLRGTGTNSHANQGSGANVGAHQDATEIPKIMLNSTDNNIYFQNAMNQQYSHYIKQDSDLDTSQGVKNTGYYVTTNGTFDATGTTSHYTTRPTNTSVLYCIKY